MSVGILIDQNGTGRGIEIDSGGNLEDHLYGDIKEKIVKTIEVEGKNTCKHCGSDLDMTKRSCKYCGCRFII